MGRELDTDADAVRTSKTFRYYDWAIITLPLKSGESAPIVFRVSTAAITMQAAENFVVFTLVAFLGAYGRLPTPTEQDDWTNALEAAAAISQSALLIVAQDRITDLFESVTYTARNRTDYEFVTDVYSAYLERSPDPDGRAAWLQVIADEDRAAVLAGFANSFEFASRVQQASSPQAFEPDIESYTPIRLSEGRSFDDVSISLVNAENTYSQILNKGDRLLYPSRAVAGRAFKIADGTYRADTILVGAANFGDISGKNADLRIVSDMSRRGATIVEPLTQRCLNVYKAPGCDSPDPSPTCSRILDDSVNGCASKDPAPMLIGATNNQPSFRGAPQPAASTQVELDSDIIAGGGFGGDNLQDPRDIRMRPTSNKMASVETV